MNISIALTHHNRPDMLHEALAGVLEDERITEIVISDDASDPEIYNHIAKRYAEYPKVKLFLNDRNQDCYRNKMLAIKRCTNEWVCIWDSDNVFPKQYIDRIENLWVAGLNEKTVYQPSFAMPHFNFKKWEGISVNRGNVAGYVRESTFETMLNAFNYFVNREQFLKVWDGSIDPVTSDSIFHNYNWLKAGNSIYIVPELYYDHRVHDGSHYQKNVRRTQQGFHRAIVNQLMDLK